MTKIYLIEGHFYKNGTFTNVNFEVFTNKKLAKTYLEYKEITKSKWLERGYEDVRYTIEEFRICNIDWSKELLELQVTQLPF